MILLDTSVCIEILRGRDRTLYERFLRDRAQCHLCEIVVGELIYGFVKEPHALRERATRHLIGELELLPLGITGAEAYARIRNDLRRQGLVIGANDLLIAATALAHGATLVTGNTDEFSRVAGLRIEDWRA